MFSNLGVSEIIVIFFILLPALLIIITIMVLELKVPHGADMQSLLLLWPVFMICFARCNCVI